MKKSLLLVITILLVGCQAVQPAESIPAAGTGEAETSVPPAVSTPTSVPTETPAALRADLPELGAAPELTNDVWLNSTAPLRLADLRGQVVLIDMWTFG